MPSGGSSTPTTVSGLPLIVIVEPTTSGLSLKRCRQNDRLSTATGAALPGALSASVNSRPRSAFNPRTSKNDPVTKMPVRRCGSFDPVRFTLWPRYIAAASSASFGAASSRYSSYDTRPRGNEAVRLQIDTRRSAFG